MSFFRFRVLAVVMLLGRGYADDAIAKSMKSEGGLVISWELKSGDRGANQIEILDEQGREVVKLNVLKPVQDAKVVGIDDVSARGNLIAVAAVYVNKEGPRKIRNAAALLLFDLRGKLQSTVLLDAAYAIARLAVDDDSNVWTLTYGPGRGAVDPAKVPMIVEYTSKGVIQKELLPRNLFPFHAYDTQEDVDIGAPAMGYEAGVVWFWLPGSTDLVTISTSNYKVSTVKPGLPKADGISAPLAIKRDPSGGLVTQVSEDSRQGRVLAIYEWSAATGWSRFKPGNCDGQMLIGTSEQGPVYLPFEAVHTSTCHESLEHSQTK